jgi:phage terminase small subunit
MASQTRNSYGLTEQQERFVQEYLVDMNATKAAERAGYSQKTAYAQGFRLLKHAEVAQRLRILQEKRAARVEITADRVLEELKELAFSDVTHYQVDADGKLALAEGAPGYAMRAISLVKHKSTTYGEGEHARTEHSVEIRLWDKPNTLKLAGRHVGLFPDKFAIEAEVGPALSKILLLAAQRASQKRIEAKTGQGEPDEGQITE